MRKSIPYLLMSAVRKKCCINPSPGDSRSVSITKRVRRRCRWVLLIWPLAPFIIERKCNELPAAAAAEENIFSQWSHRNPWDIWPYGERNTVVYAPQQFPFFFPWGTVNHMCVDGGQSERGHDYSSLESRRDRECLWLNHGAREKMGKTVSMASGSPPCIAKVRWSAKLDLGPSGTRLFQERK